MLLVEPDVADPGGGAAATFVQEHTGYIAAHDPRYNEIPGTVPVVDPDDDIWSE